jgi:putative endonuclease
MPFYIYILHSEKANKYYVGYSENHWKRLTEHNTVEHSTYTLSSDHGNLKGYFISDKMKVELLRLSALLKNKNPGFY